MGIEAGSETVGGTAVTVISESLVTEKAAFFARKTVQVCQRAVLG